MGYEDDNHNRTCWIQFYPLSASALDADILVGVAVVGCVQGSWSQVSTFSCNSHCLPLTRNAITGVSEYFSRICAIIQIKYVLQKLCHLPQYSYGSRDPTTELLLFDQFVYIYLVEGFYKSLSKTIFWLLSVHYHIRDIWDAFFCMTQDHRCDMDRVGLDANSAIPMHLILNKVSSRITTEMSL